MSAQEISTPKDPRLDSKFRPELFPLSDLGDSPPVGTPHRNDRIRLEFLGAYYELNVAFARSLTARGHKPAKKHARIEREIAQFRAIRDHLEDCYAPYGVIAEATVVKGFVVNIAFTFPDESRWYHEQRSTEAWQAELRFPLPGNAGNHQ